MVIVVNTSKTFAPELLTILVFKTYLTIIKSKNSTQSNNFPLGFYSFMVIFT